MSEAGWLVNHTRVVIFTYNFGCSPVALAHGWVERTSQVPTAVAGTAAPRESHCPWVGRDLIPTGVADRLTRRNGVKRPHTRRPLDPSEPRPYLFAIPVVCAGAVWRGGDTTRANGRQPWCPNRVSKTTSACGISGPSRYCRTTRVGQCFILGQAVSHLDIAKANAHRIGREAFPTGKGRRCGARR